MLPVICKIGPFTFYSYGAMLIVAFFLATRLAQLEAKRQNINPEIIFSLSFNAFIFGVIGARLFYVFDNFSYYRDYPLEIIMLQQGGLSWFGGFILATLSGIIYLKRKKVPLYSTLDLIIPFVALAQAVGRIGCFLNGCCFGEPFLVIPVQIISAFLLLLIFMVLRFFQTRPHKTGQLFFAYTLFYSLKRFSVEFWRADNEVIFMGLSLFQILSIALFILSIVMLLIIRKSKR